MKSKKGSIVIHLMKLPKGEFAVYEPEKEPKAGSTSVTKDKESNTTASKETTNPTPVPTAASTGSASTTKASTSAATSNNNSGTPSSSAAAASVSAATNNSNSKDSGETKPTQSAKKSKSKSSSSNQATATAQSDTATTTTTTTSSSKSKESTNASSKEPASQSSKSSGSSKQSKQSHSKAQSDQDQSSQSQSQQVTATTASSSAAATSSAAGSSQTGASAASSSKNSNAASSNQASNNVSEKQPQQQQTQPVQQVLPPPPPPPPPRVIIRGEENSKDIFPYSEKMRQLYSGQQGLSQMQQSQQQQQQSKTDSSAKSQLNKSTDLLEKPKKHRIVIPQCSHWFDLEKVHQIEKDSLPEFFQGKPSKTPEIYKKYRNFIVQLYRGNPSVHLTATACRRNLAGDVCSILRLHAFLEEWGIINFSSDPKLSAQSMLLFKPRSTHQAMYKYATTSSKRLDLLDEDRDQFDEGTEGDLVFNSVKILSKNSRPRCDFCGIVCGLIWFNSRESIEASMPNLSLCVKCYTEGNYPGFLCEKDFDRMDLISRLSGVQSGNGSSAGIQIQQEWTHEETQKLLEKIVEHKDNWDLIMQETPGRTREEIILHFLRLPLRNISQVRMFDNEDESTATLSERYPYESIADDDPTIFSDYSNPLMQHVTLIILHSDSEHTQIKQIAIFKSLLDKARLRKTNLKAMKKAEQQALLKAEQLKIEEEIRLKEKVEAAAAAAAVAVDKIEIEEASLNEKRGGGVHALDGTLVTEASIVEESIPAENTQKKSNAMDIENTGVHTEEITAATATAASASVLPESTLQTSKNIISAAVAELATITSTTGASENGTSNKQVQPQQLGLVEEIGACDEEDLFGIELETKRRAALLKRHEENKIKKLVQTLIFCQLQKIESKLSYLEEYEKLIWYERNQLEVAMRHHVAETSSLAYRRNEFTKEFTRQYAEHHKRQQAIAEAAAIAAAEAAAIAAEKQAREAEEAAARAIIEAEEAAARAIIEAEEAAARAVIEAEEAAARAVIEAEQQRIAQLQAEENALMEEQIRQQKEKECMEQLLQKGAEAELVADEGVEGNPSDELVAQQEGEKAAAAEEEQRQCEQVENVQCPEPVIEQNESEMQIEVPVDEQKEQVNQGASNEQIESGTAMQVEEQLQQSSNIEKLFEEVEGNMQQ